MKYLYWAWAFLLGLDKETAEERAFRHEREFLLSQLVLPALLGLVVAYAIASVASASNQMVIKILVLSAIGEGVMFLGVNAALKWHQKKYGGD